MSKSSKKNVEHDPAREKKPDEAKEQRAPDPVENPAVPAPEEEPLRDQLLRLRADFDNFRKRTLRERNELFLYANEAFFTDVLPVIDHFEMGLKSAEEHQTDSSVIEGFRLVYNQLLDTLKKFNVKPIDAAGEPFDPHRHEALTHLPSDQPPETVIEQVRRGYMLGDRLLRAAQVIVSSGPEKETGTPAKEPDSDQ